MAILVTLAGPQPGRSWVCQGSPVIIGRQTDCSIWLESPAVSRQHAQILIQGDTYYIEDLHSANGTFINGHFVDRPTPITENDRLEIGPYVFALRPEVPPSRDSQAPGEGPPRPPTVLRAEVEAQASNNELFAHNGEKRFQQFLETAQGLGHHLDLQTLLDNLLEQLFRLFPVTDRGMVILCEGDEFHVKAQRQRHVAHRHRGPVESEGIGATRRSGMHREGDFTFSRSVVRRALEKGVGQLCEDAKQETDLGGSIALIELRSFMCVPLLGRDQKRLGVLQLDCVTPGKIFHEDDLKLLTVLGMHVATIIENTNLYAERLREEALRHELELARDIQQSYLPRNFEKLGQGRFDLFASVTPARSVAGDLYDCFLTPGGELAFFLGDVSGKGMPSALFMIAVRTLARALASTVLTPAEMLVRLNDALVADNPTSLYVTLSHGTYDPRTGDLELVSGGHPAPLLRQIDGQVIELELEQNIMLGSFPFDEPPVVTHRILQPGELLILYSDGITEARTPDKKQFFEVEGLMQTVTALPPLLPLAECADRIRARVNAFTRGSELQDDQTLLLLRRLR